MFASFLIRVTIIKSLKFQSFLCAIYSVPDLDCAESLHFEVGTVNPPFY